MELRGIHGNSMSNGQGEFVLPYLHFFSDRPCPFCKRASDLQLLHAAAMVTEKSGKTGRAKFRPSETQFRGLFVCSYCRSPATIDFHKKTDVSSVRRGVIPKDFGSYLNRLVDLETSSKGSSKSRNRVLAIQDPENFGIDLHTCCEIDAVYPSEASEAPADLPPKISALYEEIENVRNSPRHTCIACRSVLDAVCAERLSGSPNNLRNGIEKLVEQGQLPQAMADWAHEIRMSGNVAVHEADPIPEEEATELRDYTRMLLELIYSYPARIDRRRSDK